MALSCVVNWDYILFTLFDNRICLPPDAAAARGNLSKTGRAVLEAIEIGKAFPSAAGGKSFARWGKSIFAIDFPRYETDRGMPMRALLLVLVLVAGLPAWVGDAWAQGRRVVLAVGIGPGYQYQNRLSATPNDARLVAGTLAGLGFVASGGGPLVDPDKRSFDAAVAQFGRDAQGAEIAVFYYSGHGMQIDGRNWMIPTDGRSVRPADLARQHVGLHDVMAAIEQAKPKLALIILDACRNNPNQQVATRGLSTIDQQQATPQPGLAAMQAPAGTVIAFATAPDSVSSDGPPGGYSPYTEQLIKAMRTPGLDMFRVFNTAAVETRRLSSGQQNPWVSYSPIEGEFYFVERGQQPPAPNLAALPNPAPTAPPVAPGPSQQQAPQQTAPAAPGPQAQQAQDPSFYLVNLSGRRLADLRASLETDNDWGANRVQGAGLASPGQIGVNLPAGQSCGVDVRVTPQGDKPTEIRNVQTCQTTYMMLTRNLQLQPADADVTLINATGRTIRGLRASLSSENDWGQELLGPQGLPPGGRIQLSFAKGQACSIDVRAEFGANTQALERMQVQTCTINEYALK